MKVMQTEAYKKEKIIDNSRGKLKGLGVPWSLKDHKIEPLLLNCAFEEFLGYLNEPAMIRPGFEITKESVVVPSFFVKVNGFFETEIEDSNLLKLDGYSGLLSPHYFKRDSIQFYSKENGLNIEGFLKSGYENLDFLNPSARKEFLLAIERVLNNLSEDFDLQEAEHTLLFCSLNIAKMFHKFDFQDKVPKIVIVENEGRFRSLSKDTLLILLLARELSFDIIILSEDGYSSIENKLEEKDYVLYMHQNLEKKAEQSKEFSNIFKWFFGIYKKSEGLKIILYLIIAICFAGFALSFRMGKFSLSSLLILGGSIILIFLTSVITHGILNLSKRSFNIFKRFFGIYNKVSKDTASPIIVPSVIIATCFAGFLLSFGLKVFSISYFLLLGGIFIIVFLIAVFIYAILNIYEDNGSKDEK